MKCIQISVATLYLPICLIKIYMLVLWSKLCSFYCGDKHIMQWNIKYQDLKMDIFRIILKCLSFATEVFFYRVDLGALSNMIK